MKGSRRREAADQEVVHRCKRHPRRLATVWAKIGAQPGMDLCEECFMAVMPQIGLRAALDT